jgi:hypothetical protein
LKKQPLAAPVPRLMAKDHSWLLERIFPSSVRLMRPECAVRSSKLMFIYDLFSPATLDGAIFQLQQSSRASYSPFRWEPGPRRWVRAEILMDRFMTLREATRSEIAAAGLTPGDLSRP